MFANIENNYENNKIKLKCENHKKSKVDYKQNKKSLKMVKEDCLKRKAIVKIVRIDDEIGQNYIRRNTSDFDPKMFLSISMNVSPNKSTISSNALPESEASSIVNSTLLKVPTPKINDKKMLRKNFCIYCKKLYHKLSKHLVQQHKNEERVKEFLRLPKHNLKRKILINKLIRLGNYLHNIDPVLNTEILLRNREKFKFNEEAQDFAMCASCQGFFSKKVIHTHVKKCSFIFKKNSRIKKYLSSLRKASNNNANNEVESGNLVNKENILEMVGNDTQGTESGLEIVKTVEPCITNENAVFIANLIHTIDSNNLIKKSSPNIELPSSSPIDEISPKLPPSNVDNKVKSRIRKKYFCVFCKKLICTLPRHFTTVHKNEERVQEFSGLLINDPVRIQLVRKLRLEGYSMQNSDPRFNTETVNTNQQLQKKPEKIVDDNNIKPSCQSENDIHPIANDLLRQFIIPLIYSDSILRLIKNDELIMMMGNKLTQQYNISDFHDRLRTKLKLLGCFKISLMRQVEGLDQLSSAFRPDLYGATLEAIYKCSNYGEKSPSRATAIVSNINVLLKSAASVWICKCIKENNEVEKSNTKKYIQLYNNDFPTFMDIKVLRKKVHDMREKKRIPITNDNKIVCSMETFPTANLKDVTNASESLHTAISKDNQNVNLPEIKDKDENELNINFMINNSTSENNDNVSSSTENHENDNDDYHEENNAERINRRRWTDAEKKIVIKFFGDLGNLQKLPSLDQCREVIKKFSIIRHRTAPQIKSWIHNQRRAKFDNQVYFREL